MHRACKSGVIQDRSYSSLLRTSHEHLRKLFLYRWPAISFMLLFTLFFSRRFFRLLFKLGSYVGQRVSWDVKGSGWINANAPFSSQKIYISLKLLVLLTKGYIKKPSPYFWVLVLFFGNFIWSISVILNFSRGSKRVVI